MFKISPRISSFIGQLPSFFSPTDRKIARVVEKLKDPNLKVIILSEKKTKFNLVRNSLILGFFLSLFKKEPNPENAPTFLKVPLYSPLTPIIISLKNSLTEKKTNEYGLESIQDLIKKVKRIVQNSLDSPFYFFESIVASKQVKEQKKQIEHLTIENNCFKAENNDLKKIIESLLAEKSIFSNEIQEKFKNMTKVLNNHDKKIEVFEDKVTLLLNTLKSHEQKTEELLKILKDNTQTLSRLIISANEKNKEIFVDIHSKLDLLEKKMDTHKNEVEQLAESLKSLQNNQDMLLDEINNQEKMLKEITQKSDQINLDIQKIRDQLNSSLLEKIKNLSEQKLGSFLKEL